MHVVHPNIELMVRPHLPALKFPDVVILVLLATDDFRILSLSV